MISIAGYSPASFTGPHYAGLSPSPDILFDYKRDPNPIVYTQRFNKEILSNLNVHQVLQELQQLVPGATDVALCCYEKAGIFCHRHLVADWLHQYHIPCMEWTEPFYLRRKEEQKKTT